MKNIITPSYRVFLLVFFSLLSNFGISQLQYSITRHASGTGQNGIQLETWVNCDGQVVVYMAYNNDIRDVHIWLDSPDNNGNTVYHDFYSQTTPGSQGTIKVLNFPTSNQNAFVTIQFDYRTGSNNWHNNFTMHQDYSRVSKSINEFDADYELNELSPNNFQVEYSGTSTATSNYYQFYTFNFGDGNGTLYSTSDLLPNDIIATRFFCRDDDDLYQNFHLNTELIINEHFVAHYPPTYSSSDLICNTHVYGTIELDNLCTYITAPTYSPGPNEFKPIVHTGTVTDAGLIPFVTQNKLDYDYDVNNIGAFNVQFDHNYTNANYQNSPGNHIINEHVEFQGGCGCDVQAGYNTNNPCMNMSGISYSVVYDQGQNHFVFTPGQYAGTSSVGNITLVTLNFGDGTTNTQSPDGLGNLLDVQHDFTGTGPYTVTQTTYFAGESSPCVITIIITQAILNNSEYCCENFSLDGETKAYWVSGWVMEDSPSQQKDYGQTSYIEIEFLGGSNSTPAYQFYPTGEIIEGWQRIVGKFSVPTDATNMKIHLVGENPSYDSYFDDVRIHPFNASMKSYVYDPETYWLTAELDDNNYATFYEYDNEGQLIRIKKETARGVMTIQESRSANKINH